MNIWLGDSWFASVRTAIEVSEYAVFIIIVKMSHVGYDLSLPPTLIQEIGSFAAATVSCFTDN